MPALDKYHHVVVEALIADGWTITADPLTLTWGERDLFVDLAAEKSVVAQKKGRTLAVEIRSFLSLSAVDDLEKAFGKYSLYRLVLAQSKPDWELFLAIPLEAFLGILSEPLGELVIREGQVRLIVFDEDQRRIVRWIP